MRPHGNRVLLAAVAAAVLAIGLIVVQDPYTFVPDDVYFYLTIADFLVRGQGSTFNGLMPTNGYHPLWMGVSVLERILVGGKGLALLQVHLLLSVASLGAMAAFYLKLVRSALPRAPGVGLIPLLAYSSYNALGSEYHVSLPLLLLSLLLAHRNTRPDHPPSVPMLLLQGVLMGLAALARLDNIFVLACLGLSTALAVDPVATRRLRPAARFLAHACCLAAPASLVLAPYLIWNLVVFGRLVPISGSIKAGLVTQGYAPLLGTQAKLLGATTAAGLGFLTVVARRPADRFLLALAIGATVHFAYIALGMAAVWTWYFAGEVLLLSVTCDRLWEALATDRSNDEAARNRGAMWLAAALLVVMTPIGLKHLRSVGSIEPWFVRVAAWYDGHVPAGTAIATTVSPGSQAYFSSRPVVALDGLTLDFAFFEEAEARGVHAVLVDLGVRYVIAPGPESPELAVLGEATRLLGHGTEGVAFYTPPDQPETLTGVAVVSPFTGQNLGNLRTDASTLEHAFDAASTGRAMALYRLTAAE